jgi:hypothetical protein
VKFVLNQVISWSNDIQLCFPAAASIGGAAGRIFSRLSQETYIYINDTFHRLKQVVPT